MAKHAHGRNALVDGDPGKAKGPEARSFRGFSGICVVCGALSRRVAKTPGNTKREVVLS